MNREINAGGAEFSRPDWVMCGFPVPGGVRLLASKDMTHAELSVDHGYEDMFGLWEPPVLTSRRITLPSGLKTFVMIEAPDYPSAFRALFEQWTPGPGEHAALPGIPAIEGRA